MQIHEVCITSIKAKSIGSNSGLHFGDAIIMGASSGKADKDILMKTIVQAECNQKEVCKNCGHNFATKLNKLLEHQNSSIILFVRRLG